MRVSIGCVALSLALACTPFQASCAGIDEGRVFDALNEARADPASLVEDLRRYRGFFHANLVRYPDQDVDMETQEGVGVVDETIGFLGRQSVLATLQPSIMLQASAADLVADQGRTGRVGHAGSDGSSPALRVQRRGGGSYVAEVVAYGPMDAADALRQLIVDDGVADRGHREIIYSSELRYAGVACGPHPIYRTMCVIDLGITPDGRYAPRGGRRAAR